MSYKLACVATGKIAALGSVSGYPMSGMISGCTPSGPIPICHIHGASDNFVTYSGVASWLSTFVKVERVPGIADDDQSVIQDQKKSIGAPAKTEARSSFIP